MTKVAVIGLGAMGSRFARRFIDAGHDVVVWNRDAKKAAPLVPRGARPAGTPCDAARDADAIVIMVADPGALAEVTEGPNGVAAGAAPASTVLQMSTVNPRAVQRLLSVLPAGTGLLDAPVLGSISEAEAGTLRIFIGGPEALAKRWTPLLGALGTPLHVGGLGAGTAAKLMANATLLDVLCVLGEALALGRGLGLTSDAAFEVLASTPIGAQAERRRPAIERGEYPVRFQLALACKDAGLILEAAKAAGVELRSTEGARSWFCEAEAAGLGRRDYSAVLSHILASRVRT